VSRPVPLAILLLLLLGLCGLCAWQWNREELLRDLTRRQLAENGDLRKALEETSARAKAGDAEILRLTETLSEIKTASVAKAQYDEALAAAQTMREGVLKQNAALKEQQEALLKANAAVAQANQAIEKTAAERDGLSQKLNALTLQYNRLVKRLQLEAAEAAPGRDAGEKPQ
jgi:chromosome segregation ATPase